MQAVVDASSNEAAYIFDRLWLCRYPRPSRVFYDQGTEFKKEFYELLDSYGIATVPTTTCIPQTNGIIERLHRVIGDKMRTQEIVTHHDWKNFLYNTTSALRASFHAMLGASPAQATFGRDMIVDVQHTTDWHEQHTRRLEQVHKNNLRENAGRRTWTYHPGDPILLKRDGNINSKLTTLYDGPYTMIAVRDNGTLVIDKGRYTETAHIRRIVPYKVQRVEDCEQPDKSQRASARK